MNISDLLIKALVKASENAGQDQATPNGGA